MPLVLQDARGELSVLLDVAREGVAVFFCHGNHTNKK
jgi:UDP-2,3-diacylglucosamine pyrophosphatase LpxH